mgnify:CR=1 FL=1
MSTLLDLFRGSSALYGGNAAFIEDLYERYLVDPESIDVAWRARFDDALDPAVLYDRLRAASPAPFAGLLAGATEGAPWAVVSSSPERLVSVRGDVVETRPIAAGPRP